MTVDQQVLQVKALQDLQAILDQLVTVDQQALQETLDLQVTQDLLDLQETLVQQVLQA